MATLTLCGPSDATTDPAAGRAHAQSLLLILPVLRAEAARLRREVGDDDWAAAMYEQLAEEWRDSLLLGPTSTTEVR